MKVIDKLLMVVTGAGLVSVGVQALRHRNDPKLRSYECPFCHITHECTEGEFALHVTEVRRGAH